MSIKGIIFDFDGTLFDSMSIWENAGSDFLRSCGRTPEEGLGRKINEMSLMQSAKYLKDRYDLPLSVEEILIGVDKTVEDFYFHKAMPKEYVVSVLSEFKAEGVKMCIATASDRYQIEAALKRCNMTNFFDAVYTCTEVGHGKDEPYIFEHALSHLNTGKSETAVFEDAYYAAKTAKDSGFFVVGVYDRYEKRTDEVKQIADLYVRDFSEVKKLLDV